VSSAGAEISNTSTNPKVAVPAFVLSIKSLESVGFVPSVISTPSSTPSPSVSGFVAFVMKPPFSPCCSAPSLISSPSVSAFVGSVGVTTLSKE